MPLSIALQMDPIGSIDISGDTSFALALEAQARGHTLWYYTPESLSSVSYTHLTLPTILRV